MRCRDLMTRDVVTVREDDRVDAATRRMRDANVGFVPVCDEEGRPTGTLTDRDVAIRVCAHDRRSGRTHVGEVMTRELLTCREEDDVARAAELMAGRHKSRIVVVDERGAVAGVLSLADLVRREDDEARTLRTMRRVLEREVRR